MPCTRRVRAVHTVRAVCVRIDARLNRVSLVHLELRELLRCDELATYELT